MITFSFVVYGASNKLCAQKVPLVNKLYAQEKVLN